MKRNTVLRHVTLGALATGLVPLTAAGAGARSTGDSALCRSTFGDRGPTGGRIVGEGPSGDPMAVNIGWDPADWPGGGLDRIVTCVSVDGHAVPALTTSTASPPNAGGLTLTLTLPAGEPGSLVCEQSVLVGGAGAEGRNRTTSPVCFKLRAADPPPPTRAGGRTSDGPAPNGPAGPTTRSNAPPGPPAPSPHAPPGPPVAGPRPKHPAGPPAPGTAPTTPDPASTPPARAAFEAAGAGAAPTGRAVAGRTAAGPASTTPAPDAGAATADAAAGAGAPAVGLARTGVDDQLPLAGAGGLLAFGGAAILLAEPRRRRGWRLT